jgi:LPXTG-motif cell wall-anchored protein
VTCTGTHAITQTDLDNGSFADTGHATSTEADASDVTDTIHAAPISPTTTTTTTVAAADTTSPPPPPSGTALPFTGTGTGPALFGITLLLAGVALLARKRRRR